jgi:hypothetical protein
MRVAKKTTFVWGRSVARSVRTVVALSNALTQAYTSPVKLPSYQLTWATSRPSILVPEVPLPLSRTQLARQQDHQTHLIIASGRIKSKGMKTETPKEMNPGARKRITAYHGGRTRQESIGGQRTS